ncbi:sensor histidine kinase [Paenibacillus sp. OV219]|uniref:sensor histidine kinase n=1 Tax=Paenibacillus sp. OV219 TaxID=1884377 RepID=UPI0008B32091|nr:histidine kinase [Paenibacillus sp. OV219]SEO88792.1 two-component system, sensor histidine kinase YesM [Paenibacillus sp. OV219]
MSIKNRIKVSMSGLWPKTLKNRLFIILGFNVLIPLLLVIFISYKSVYPLLDQRIRTGIQNNLNLYQMSLENTLANINNVSQILAYDGRIGKKLSQFLSEKDLYKKTQINNDIQQDLTIISSTNPTLGLFFYYFEDQKKILYQNYTVNPDFSLVKLPRLVELNGITYYGPHLTNRQYSDVQVLSVARKIVMPDQNNVYVYLETGYKLWDKINQTGHEDSMNEYRLIVDQENRVTFSENTADFPIGSILRDSSAGKLKEARGYYVFETASNQGWKAVYLISKAAYHKEVIRWIEQLVVILIISILLCSLFALAIWRMVYVPLRKVNQDMRLVENSDFDTPLSRFSIVEFDTMMRHFDTMRDRVKELLEENALKEQRRADFEVEKLLYQINPHFIHNTLDTIQWLARLKGQEDIDTVATSLNKLLYYNLGKKGPQSTIAEELEALKDYLTLQKIRYDFEFSVTIEVGEELQNCLVPRFILQPLVENSLYHGNFDKNGLIEVTVEPDGGAFMIIRIRDNGRGMTQETIARLLEKQSEEQNRIGLGIGVYYVKRVFDSQYDGQAAFDMTSAIGEGTCITLRLPRMYAMKKGESL